jgi:hypothetical protein
MPSIKLSKDQKQGNKKIRSIRTRKNKRLNVVGVNRHTIDKLEWISRIKADRAI